ncbi:MAG: methyltransferase, CheR-type [Ilumatobacteraceae bacterium]|nr:methyltransferase, CheR-type [Ilumatobacteraceae bacterium]
MSKLDSVLDAAAQLLSDRIGLRPDASFRPRLVRALDDLATARQIEREELVAGLSSMPGLLDDLLDRVTVQETSFFRHPEQFATLKRDLLPTMRGPVRAWSAACANGQEAYSLAITLAESDAATTTRPAVLATDISPAALHRTTIARYAERELTGVDEDRRRRCFQFVDNAWQVRHDIRKMVGVRRYNLLDTIPDEVSVCQIVMCRNVLIYLAKDHAESFLHRLSKAMHSDAYLFVGGAETLWQLTDRFEPMQLHTGYVYRPTRSRRRPTPHTTELGGAHRNIAIEAADRPSARAAAAAATAKAPAAALARVAQPLPVPTAVVADSSSCESLGIDLLALDKVDEAIVVFRRWAYDAPDDPRAHFHLGTALERADEHNGARRAFGAALAAIERCGPEPLRDLLQGYEIDAFRRLILDRSNDLGDLARNGQRDGLGTSR